MLKHTLYFIDTLTNTHVGSGDSGFDVIDNRIQKDPVTGIPIFQSSSLKGALRDYYGETNINNTSVDNKGSLIFGSEGASEMRQGSVIFHDARLLFLPVRGITRPFYYATSMAVLRETYGLLSTFGIMFDKQLFPNVNKPQQGSFWINGEGPAFLEDKKIDTHKHQDLFNDKVFQFFASGIDLESIAILEDSDFADYCRDALPIIARNKIGENGTSENLFYEEMLPRQSRLWTLFSVMNGNQHQEINNFIESLDKTVIQLGANSTIGCGFCHFTKREVSGGLNE